MDRIDALNGALVADAAALGLHWLYDQEQLARIAATGEVLFRQPEAAVYAGVKGYFAHGSRRAGEPSQYGESVRLVADLALSGEYTSVAHRSAFLSSFGPGGSFVGYADRPTRALVAKILVCDAAIKDPSGSDDDQLPGLAPVPGLFAAGQADAMLEVAVGVTTTHPHALAGARTVMHALRALADGANLSEALVTSANAAPDELGESMRTAIELPDYQPLAVAQRFGSACRMRQGLPVAWHLLQHGKDFPSILRDNILCGGDSCGRAVAIGAIAGLHFGGPGELAKNCDFTLY